MLERLSGLRANSAGGVIVSGDMTLSLVKTSRVGPFCLVKEYGDDLRLPSSGTGSATSVVSLDGLRCAFRARSSSLVGGMGIGARPFSRRLSLEALPVRTGSGGGGLRSTMIGS